MAYSVYSGEITPQQLLADGVVGIGAGLVFHKPIGALTAKFGAAETAAPSLVQRLGPTGVDPLHHNANVLVRDASRSEEHTSELQSLMRISYAVFCLKKKNT